MPESKPQWSRTDQTKAQWHQRSYVGRNIGSFSFVDSSFHPKSLSTSFRRKSLSRMNMIHDSRCICLSELSFKRSVVFTFMVLLQQDTSKEPYRIFWFNMILPGYRDLLLFASMLFSLHCFRPRSRGGKRTPFRRPTSLVASHGHQGSFFKCRVFNWEVFG